MHPTQPCLTPVVYSTDCSKVMVPVLVLLIVAFWFILQDDVLCLALCYFVLVFFNPFSIAITTLGEERANLSAFCTFIPLALVWFCLLPLPLGVWEGLHLVNVALPGLSSYLSYPSSTLSFPSLPCSTTEIITIPTDPFITFACHILSY